MMLRRLSFTATIVALLASGGQAQTTYWVTTTLSDDVPTRTRAPFSLDTRERRPTAIPGPPISQEEAESLGCQALPNGFVVCPPGALSMRSRRVARPRTGPVAMQDTLPPDPADVPTPTQPTAPTPSPQMTPYASPQRVPYASPQRVPYPSFQSPPQATTDWSQEEVDQFSISRRHTFRPVRPTASWVGQSVWPVPTSQVSSSAYFTSSPWAAPTIYGACSPYSWGISPCQGGCR